MNNQLVNKGKIIITNHTQSQALMGDTGQIIGQRPIEMFDLSFHVQLKPKSLK